MISLTNSRSNLSTAFSSQLNLLALLAICGSLLAASLHTNLLRVRGH